MPSAATVTLARMSAPSMPKSATGCSPPWSATVSSKTGWSQWASRPSSGGQPITSPRRTVGMASRMSGTVIDRGDSWMCGSTLGSTRLSPQNVRPMSRNM